MRWRPAEDEDESSESNAAIRRGNYDRRVREIGPCLTDVAAY